jgi:outer membrane protein TolC
VLLAVREVEDALESEYHAGETARRLKQQEEIAQQTLIESRRRYVQGLSDYIRVISAIQSLQLIQRNVISQQAQVLRARGRLYRALGGSWAQTVLNNSGEPSQDQQNTL